MRNPSVIFNCEKHEISQKARNILNQSLIFEQRKYSEGYLNGYIQGILAIMTLLRITKKRKSQINEYITEVVKTNKYLTQ